MMHNNAEEEIEKERTENNNIVYKWHFLSQRKLCLCFMAWGLSLHSFGSFEKKSLEGAVKCL